MKQTKPTAADRCAGWECGRLVVAQRKILKQRAALKDLNERLAERPDMQERLEAGFRALEMGGPYSEEYEDHGFTYQCGASLFGVTIRAKSAAEAKAKMDAIRNGHVEYNGVLRDQAPPKSLRARLSDWFARWR